MQRAGLGQYKESSFGIAVDLDSAAIIAPITAGTRMERNQSFAEGLLDDGGGKEAIEGS